jgi:uncharacterized protein
MAVWPDQRGSAVLSETECWELLARSSRGVGVVVFEVDETAKPAEAPEAWSVMVQGRAEVVRDPVELERAVSTGVTPLVGTPGEVYVKVHGDAVSGRRFSVSGLGCFTLGPQHQAPQH